MVAGEDDAKVSGMDSDDKGLKSNKGRNPLLWTPIREILEIGLGRNVWMIKSDPTRYGPRQSLRATAVSLACRVYSSHFPKTLAITHTQPA